MAFRIGLIVPSSNVTMETEIPAMLRRRSEAFTFHSSRTRMQRVTAEELARMDADGERCVAELADAACDAIAYACLIAVVAQGNGAHVGVERRLAAAAEEIGSRAPVVSSAGALVRGIAAMGASRVAIVAPYLRPHTDALVAYLGGFGIEVTDAVSLEVDDNLEVARIDPMSLIDLAAGLETSRADAVVLSACVQMPSLPAIPEAERRLELPVLSAATATAREVLAALGLDPVVPGAGHLLSGAVPASTA